MRIGEYLKKIRGKDSLREASKKTGLSHNYISVLEKGADPRSKAPIKPSPETLMSYAKGYHLDYEELMKKAGYLKDGSEYITNDQAKNAVLEAYNRLPQDKKRLVDDMIKALLNEKQ